MKWLWFVGDGRGAADSSFPWPNADDALCLLKLPFKERKSAAWLILRVCPMCVPWWTGVQELLACKGPGFRLPGHQVLPLCKTRLGHVSACMHRCVCMGACLRACTGLCVWEPEVGVRCPPLSLLPLFLRQDRSLTLELTHRLSQQASEYPAFSCPHLAD